MHVSVKNKERLLSLIQKGDGVNGTVYHKKIGFAGNFEITAVDHWGVYCILRDEKLDYYCKSFNSEFKKEIEKRQFKLKWKHIYSLELL